ncbi:MAG TPA: DUF6781 family protein [Burkholderiaceae bacterium]|jgi:hypothetical protein|nr:DUF6781 family protein [Burkholderiaceae bacterium]
MAASAFDADALISMFESASAKGSAQLQKAVTEATLAALGGRELTLANIRSSLDSVAKAVTAGAANNPLGSAGVEGLLDKAVAGMDQALVKAVQANQAALRQFADRGVDLREKHLKKALDDLDKFDDLLIGAVKKAGAAAGPLAAPWQQAMEKLQAGGSMSGLSAAKTVEEFAEQMGSAMKSTRSASVRAATVLAESYAAMASGVLVGLSEALAGGSAAPASAAAPKKAATRKR